MYLLVCFFFISAESFSTKIFDMLPVLQFIYSIYVYVI